MKRFTFSISKETHFALKLMSLKQNKTMQELINRAIQEQYGNEIDEMRMMGELASLDKKQPNK